MNPNQATNILLSKGLIIHFDKDVAYYNLSSLCNMISMSIVKELTLYYGSDLKTSFSEKIDKDNRRLYIVLTKAGLCKFVDSLVEAYSKTLTIEVGSNILPALIVESGSLSTTNDFKIEILTKRLIDLGVSKYTQDIQTTYDFKAIMKVVGLEHYTDSWIIEAIVMKYPTDITYEHVTNRLTGLGVLRFFEICFYLQSWINNKDVFNKIVDGTSVRQLDSIEKGLTKENDIKDDIDFNIQNTQLITLRLLERAVDTINISSELSFDASSILHILGINQTNITGIKWILETLRPVVSTNSLAYSAFHLSGKGVYKFFKNLHNHSELNTLVNREEFNKIVDGTGIDKLVISETKAESKDDSKAETFAKNTVNVDEFMKVFNDVNNHPIDEKKIIHLDEPQKNDMKMHVAPKRKIRQARCKYSIRTAFRDDSFVTNFGDKDKLIPLYMPKYRIGIYYVQPVSPVDVELEEHYAKSDIKVIFISEKLYAIFDCIATMNQIITDWVAKDVLNIKKNENLTSGDKLASRSENAGTIGIKLVEPVKSEDDTDTEARLNIGKICSAFEGEYIKKVGLPKYHSIHFPKYAIAVAFDIWDETPEMLRSICNIPHNFEVIYAQSKEVFSTINRIYKHITKAKLQLLVKLDTTNIHFAFDLMREMVDPYVVENHICQLPRHDLYDMCDDMLTTLNITAKATQNAYIDILCRDSSKTI